MELSDWTKLPRLFSTATEKELRSFSLVVHVKSGLSDTSLSIPRPVVSFLQSSSIVAVLSNPTS